ncbi:hypothetical protein BE20_00555 [Sorangium cellulosum]|nr:hypothetical protein BE20_00555 [Sorangium cellulosum]
MIEGHAHIAALLLRPFNDIVEASLRQPEEESEQHAPGEGERRCPAHDRPRLARASLLLVDAAQEGGARLDALCLAQPSGALQELRNGIELSSGVAHGQSPSR